MKCWQNLKWGYHLLYCNSPSAPVNFSLLSVCCPIAVPTYLYFCENKIRSNKNASELEQLSQNLPEQWGDLIN